MISGNRENIYMVETLLCLGLGQMDGASVYTKTNDI